MLLKGCVGGKERQKAFGRGLKKGGIIQIINLMARAKGEKIIKKILIRLARGGIVTPVTFADE